MGKHTRKDTNLRLVRPVSRVINISSSRRYRLAPNEGGKESIRYRIQGNKVRTGVR